MTEQEYRLAGSAPLPVSATPATPHDRTEQDKQPQPDRRPRLGYLPQLDGLRAVAIVLVLVHHALTPWKFGGLVGVDVFFVLSGYLITTLLVAEHEQSGRIALGRFYLRRAIRLYPALLLTVGVLFVPGLLLAKHTVYYLVDVAAALTYLTPIVLQVNSGASLVFRHTWSLGNEELFYLAWPLVLILLLRHARRRRAVAYVAAFGVLVLLTGVAQSILQGELSYLLRAGSLFLGCALALGSHGRVAEVRQVVGWTGALLLAASVVVATLWTDDGIAVLVASAGAVMLTAHLARPRVGVLVKALRLPAVVYIGRISYEIYLWHYPLFVLASRFTGGTFASVAWFCVPVSLLLAAGTHALLAPLSARWKVWAGRRPSRRGRALGGA